MFRMKSHGLIVSVALIIVAAISATAAFAAKPPSRKADPPCTISPSPAPVGSNYWLSVSGLPTGTPINLWVTDPSGHMSGSPLGSTGDGTFNMIESSDSAGTWTYTFAGPTKNNWDATPIYASCSVDAY
jgi:hypothetical protein